MKKILKKKSPKKSARKGRSLASSQGKSLGTSGASVRPLGDRVLIRVTIQEHAETQTASGIIIPVSAGENADKDSKRGEIIAVGPGRYDDGKIIPVSAKVGDTVLFQWGEKIVMEGLNRSNEMNTPDYYLVRESEILAIIR